MVAAVDLPLPLPKTPAEWRAAREQAGLSVTQLARRTGLTRRVLWAFETGSRPISDRVQRLVATALELDVFPPLLRWSDHGHAGRYHVVRGLHIGHRAAVRRWYQPSRPPL